MSLKKLNAKVERRLSAYQVQANSRCQKPNTSKTFRSSSLATIAPLAAMSLIPIDADGQACTPKENVFVLQSADGCIQDARIDLDGDGIFDVRLEANAVRVRLRASNTSTMSFAGMGYLSTVNNLLPFLSNVSAGAAIPGAYNFVNTAFSYILSNNTGQGNFYPAGGVTPNTGFIGFNKNGEYGFLEVTVSKRGGIQGASSCLSFGLFGVSVDMGNSVNAGDCNSLPVEYIDFDAKSTNRAIELAWTTASEVSNLGFELERSEDGKSFQKIAWIAGQGTSLQFQKYDFMDEVEDVEATYFYRLKQIDLDGSFRYSYIISETYEPQDPKTTVELFPNPTDEYIQMRIDAIEEEMADIELFTNDGNRVHKVNSIPLRLGLNHLGMSVSELPAGMYFAKVNIGKDLYYRRVVIH